MTAKEKATDLVSKNFDIIAKASNYKGLKKEGEKIFYAIESVAKKCALIAVDQILKTIIKEDYEYWKEVKNEIEKL